MDRLVFFLNGDRGLGVLRKIAEARHSVTAVVVPEATRVAAAVAPLAKEHGFRVIGAADVNDARFRAEYESLRPRLGVIAGFSTIFRKPLYSAPELGTINLHAGRVPEYRGGSPLNWQLAMGERAAGVSVLRVDDGIDSGEVLASAEIPIDSKDTIAELHAKTNMRFPNLVLQVLDAFDQGVTTGAKQDERRACYWHQRNDTDGKLDVERLGAAEALRLVRAVTRPYPGAFAFCAGRRVRIFSARHAGIAIRGVPGRICWVLGLGPYLVFRDGALLLEEYTFDDDVGAKLRHGAHLT